MSKTDKTKPYRVRMTEHKLHGDWWWYGCCTGCGCRMCTAHDERRRDRRASRHDARTELNEYRKSYREDGDVFCNIEPRGW